MLRKARGAFFTPPAIADYLAEWAVEDDPTATVLDPTCGEAVFLRAAGQKLAKLGATTDSIREQVLGVDIHPDSITESRRLLEAEDLGGSFLVEDFFALSTPDKLDARLPYVDAVIGNPPFVRYQRHVGGERKRAQQAALEQGVRLSGLASSWAALLVHACGFLKPEGRLAMVLPTELLSTGYAEPVRAWLKRRFKAVHLVLFETLQFADAEERVVLILARGSGGCRAFSLVPVHDASDLRRIRMFGPSHFSVAPPDRGKWTDLLLPTEHRQAFDRVVREHFVPLREYGAPTLGTVTGANDFFCLSEASRIEYAIAEHHVVPICPPGTRHLRGFSFSKRDWETALEAGERVWLLLPRDAELVESTVDEGLASYLERGRNSEVHLAYKCRIRDPWFRPPVVPAPDLFFTYMSHQYPRLITNAARVSFLNSMHGIRLRKELVKDAGQALPYMMLSAATMLGAEIHGRAYGGGVLKMEPREAAELPVPHPAILKETWDRLSATRSKLDRQLRQGLWTRVAKQIDRVLLSDVCGLSTHEVAALHTAGASLRRNRIGHKPGRANYER